MDFLQECQEYFGTKDLYEILEIDKQAKNSEIKSAYRKKSLKVHPDRIQDSNKKDSAKKAFQILTKIHCVLSNDEYRKVYDESGMIVTDGDSFTDLSTFEEFLNYWRTLFPKIDSKKLDEFAKNYIRSSEEEEDLKKLYLKFKGDLNMIYEFHFYYDEDRVCETLKKLIDAEEVPAFDAFLKESKSKKEKRLKRINNEAMLAEKRSKKMIDEELDLVKAIQNRNTIKGNNFNQMIQNLEAKYAGKTKKDKQNKKLRI